jgi:hypothetical protein
MTLTAIIVPSDINVKADDEELSCNDPGLDHTYIYYRAKNLSEIIEIQDYRWRSREHGEDGEQEAAERIENWMENLDLWDVHKELLDKKWDKSDNGNWGWQDPWIGELDKKRQFDKDDYLLDITVYDLRWNIIANKTFTYKNCFPFLKTNYGFSHNTDCNNVKVVKRFLPRYRFPQIVYIGKNKWSDPYGWNRRIDPSAGIMGWLKYRITNPRNVGFILGDNFSDTWFMQPSNKDHYLGRAGILEPLGEL